MSQFISHSEWEHIFTEEALTVEELLSSGDFLLLEQSKVRIALENKILAWDKFKKWITEKLNCACLKSQLSPVEIQILKNKFNENKKTFSHYEIWNNDLIPLEIWDNSLIVLGLYPPENLVTIPNSIFVLCPPEVMTEITKSEALEPPKFQQVEHSQSLSLLQLDPTIDIPTDLSFSKLYKKTETQTQTEKSQTGYSVWSLVDSNHNLSSELARKQFDAYMVLKIVENETKVYKMDEDLMKEDLNPSLFSYNLNLENAFSDLYKSGKTSSVSLENLGLTILDFKYACISPLKLGPQVLGFLVGFKIEKTTDQDENALELISNQNVA